MRRRLIRARKKFNRLFVTWFGRAVFLLARLVPYRAGVALGGGLGFLAYYALPRDRKRAVANLKAVFSNRDSTWIRRTARANFIHLGKSLLEAALMTPDRLPKVVEIDGWDRLEAAIAQGRGVVYVTAHIGNWEIMGGAVARRHPVSVVAAPIIPEAVNDMIVGLRAGLSVRTIVRGRPGASREFIRVFRENRVLGILIDQDTDVESAFVNFLGRPAWTPTAAAQMALKFGAPVVFGYDHRESNILHRVTLEGPIELIRTGDDKRDIVENTALFTKMIEEAVLKCPEQWVWMHRRWRRQP